MYIEVDPYIIYSLNVNDFAEYFVGHNLDNT
jgi:hypothetical protein